MIGWGACEGLHAAVLRGYELLNGSWDRLCHFVCRGRHGERKVQRGRPSVVVPAPTRGR